MENLVLKLKRVEIFHPGCEVPFKQVEIDDVRFEAKDFNEVTNHYSSRYKGLYPGNDIGLVIQDDTIGT
jgi:hypothetical protein